MRIDQLGAEWVIESVGSLTDEIHHVRPSTFNEEHRYLPESVTSMPGYLRYSVNPFMREIVDCFDVDSPVREVNLKKGVQITYSTGLESGALYYIAHVKTLPMMYVTADKELAKARVENNFLPMLQQSGFGDVIRSSDEGNTRKTGKTADHLQFEGGGYLVPFGAMNPGKMRSFSIAVLMMDELDGWPLTVGRDGDPDALFTARCSGYWERRKIFRGSTPLLKHSSKIEKQHRRGDQRQYLVRCKACDYPQALRWKAHDTETGVAGGFVWETDDGILLPESVRYCCQNCGAEHFEHDKERLFSEEHGAHWHPTARPAEPGIRSYHLPAFYSPVGMQPWAKCVAEYLDAWDTDNNRVRDVGKLQVFYNNVLAEPFEVMGSRVTFSQVSSHRRGDYNLGQISNAFAREYMTGPVLFLTCQVDVHKSNLAVTVMGWSNGMRCMAVDYWRFEDEDCTEITSPAWQRLREVIEGTVYTADDGQRYRVAITFVDAGFANDTVTTFCSEYGAGVYPILGRERTAKNQTIREFAEFTTKAGTVGFRILVDHYKDRLAPVLRREWQPDTGEQGPYHFNAPVNMPDKALRELVAEVRREKTDDRGNVVQQWHRPGNKPNELWDLLVYGNAAVEVMAWMICIQHFELETISWSDFWQFAALPENDELFGRLAPEPVKG